MLTTQGTIHIQSSDQRVWDEMYEKYGDVEWSGECRVEMWMQSLK